MLIEHPAESPKFENVSVQAVRSPRVDIASIHSVIRSRARSNFDTAMDKGLGDFNILSKNSGASAALTDSTANQIDALNMDRHQSTSYSNASSSQQSAPPNANENANQDTCTKPKYPEVARPVFNVPTIPLKRRGASEFINNAKRIASGNVPCHVNTNSLGRDKVHLWNANLIPRQHGANANSKPKHVSFSKEEPQCWNGNLVPRDHAANANSTAAHQSILVTKSLEEAIAYLHEKADSVLGSNANVARIPNTNSVVDKSNSASPSYSYSPPRNANLNAANANSNASLLSGIDQITFQDQSVGGFNYDNAVNNMAATVANANPLDAETILMNELLHDAIGKNDENFRNFLLNHNASAEKIALLDKLRHSAGKFAPINTCALKLLRLVHEPNHPLNGQRKRLFMTITGYKKNWWKKCRPELVQNMEVQDD
jgi:hypothetical protein